MTHDKPQYSIATCNAQPGQQAGDSPDALEWDSIAEVPHHHADGQHINAGWSEHDGGAPLYSPLAGWCGTPITGG